MSVLDDTTYDPNNASRKVMFPLERDLLQICQDDLKMVDQEYLYQLARCDPLAENTKQSLEINEEDHGKAIMVFTIVTVIFLPLSFVTSFLGMNTTDIRDMGSSSTLFWAIAVPLTATTMGSVLYIGYNGDDLRDWFSSLYRSLTGKQDRSAGARGISVAQRKRARNPSLAGIGEVNFYSAAEVEFASRRQQPLVYYNHSQMVAPPLPRRRSALEPTMMQWETYEPITRTESRRPESPAQFSRLFDSSRSRRQSGYPHPSHIYGEMPELRRPSHASRSRRRESLEREAESHMPPVRYDWVKKSHKHHHQSTRDRTSRRTGRTRDDDGFYVR